MKGALAAFAALIALASGSGVAVAQSTSAERITVGQLLKQNFTLVGSFSPRSGGAGVFLQNGVRLYFCFVSETPTSSTLTTQYCKMVE